MGVSNWQFADQFGKLYDRAQRYGIEHQDVMNDELPLIHWEGSTEYLDWLCDSTKEPPLDVVNIQRSKPHEQFLCWLMLPGDFSGKKWYFGRVFTTRLSLTDEIKVLMDFASDAGSYLRRDQLFFNYLSPCLEHHTKLAARFPTLQDDRNASYWFALLFARPELCNPLKFPYEKTIAKDTIAEATIANPFKLAVDVIHRWRLNAPTPYPADGHVAPPYQWPEAPPKTPDGDDEIPQTVTLDKMAAAVSRSKKTLERLKADGKLPIPDVEGGGGKPDEWIWSNVKPILEQHYNRKLPDRFPSLRK